MLSSLIIIEGAGNNSVIQNSQFHYSDSHYISQLLLLTSFANSDNQELWYFALGNSLVHYPPFQSLVFLIKLLQFYCVKFTKQCSLSKSPFLYVIFCRGLDNVLHAVNFPHSHLRPFLESFGRRYWDSRFRTHKCCGSYTSLLIQSAFQHNTKPCCTFKACCSSSSDYHLSRYPIKNNRTLVSTNKCFRLVLCKPYMVKLHSIAKDSLSSLFYSCLLPLSLTNWYAILVRQILISSRSNTAVGMSSVTSKPLRTARTWIILSTCKGEKSRSRTPLLLKNE